MTTRADTLELGPVQKTLLLPLWGRAIETGKAHPLLVDQRAAAILATLDYDFSTIAHNISPITRLAWIARSLHTDRTIRDFLSRYPDATIVNLGCGLDTTFERIDNGRLRWYDLDLPDVIELRKRFIQESARREFVADSLLDDAWLPRVPPAGAIFFVASGVFYYFEECQIKALFRRLADAFPGCEVLFDACSPSGLRMANRKVIKAGGMDESAVLKWGMRQAGEMRSWDGRIAVLDEYPLFRHFGRDLNVKARYGMWMSDFLGIMSMVHLRLGKPPDKLEPLKGNPDAGSRTRSSGAIMQNRASPDEAQTASAAVKSHHVCPWWLGYLLASPIRRVYYQPAKVLAAHVREGMTVLEPGPGMGFFTLELARLVGPSGRVIAVDIQPRMLTGLRRRASKAGVLDRLDTRLAAPDSLGLANLQGMVDFTLAFAMVHELPAAAAFFREVAQASKPGARLLLVEPVGHVTASHFDAELQAARDAGFALVGSPSVRRSRAALLERVKT